MQKKINKYMFLLSVLALILVLTVFMFVTYTHFVKAETNNQKIKLNLLEKSYALNGLTYFDDLNSYDDRITIIGSDGTVLFDNEVDKTEMDNHLTRAEVQGANQNGFGSSIRFSNTKYEYRLYSAIKLSDGIVIRISKPSISLIRIVLELLKAAFVIVVIAALLAAIYSKSLSAKIITPINNINLDDPIKSNVYEELSPLLVKIDNQIKNLEIKNSEIKYITENVSDGIIIISYDKMVLRVNKKAFLLTGVKENEYYLNHCRLIDFKRAVEKALLGENVAQKIKIKDSIYMLITSSVKIENDKYGVFISLRNIDEEENREKMRREFTANVSHELKTPLTSIIGISELSLNDMVSVADTTKFGVRIYKESSRLLSMIEDMLKLSRLDENNASLEFEAFSLNELIVDVSKDLAEHSAKKGIEIVQNLADVSIKGIKTLIYDLVFNIVDNAIKYSRKQGNIYINLTKNTDLIALSIKDEGVGIAESEFNNIFERFYRIDKSHSKSTGGSGLGLSIVKHIAILHHYGVEVKSDGVDKGAEFIVKIPLEASS